MTNTLIKGMKNAKLEKLVNIMALSAFLLIMGIGTAGDGDSQKVYEPAQRKTRITGMGINRSGEPLAGVSIVKINLSIKFYDLC